MRQIETKGMMEQFQAHLNNTNNQRIIFSGCFGSGKTTFLNNFFNHYCSINPPPLKCFFKSLSVL